MSRNHTIEAFGANTA